MAPFKLAVCSVRATAEYLLQQGLGNPLYLGRGVPGSWWGRTRTLFFQGFHGN